MSEFLFNEFDEVSAKEWKQKIQVDLKGADYNDTLIWKTLEGIDVKPFYHSDDQIINSNNFKHYPNNWLIGQAFFIDDEGISNKLILDAIQRGAEAIIIKAEKPFSIENVFNLVELDKISIYFDFSFLEASFLEELQHFFASHQDTVFYNVDIIGNLAKTGNWFHSLEKDHQIIEHAIASKAFKSLIAVDGTVYQNAGASMVQQLAYMLAHVNEYLNHFNQSSPDSLKNLKSTFKLSTGSNYFFEIAKISALRKLYALLAKEYNIETSCHIISQPSKRNKTLYDYNVNLLRSTTENMSAILGGANTICTMAYDALYHKSNEFGERIARNQLLVLKEESYFNELDNPASGSYYIESISDQLAEKALELFKSIEEGDGFLKQLKEGTIQRKIKESEVKEQELFNQGKISLLGTNLHPNDKDTMKHELELYPFIKQQPRKTLLEPIIEKRLSEKIELERLESENK